MVVEYPLPTVSPRLLLPGVVNTSVSAAPWTGSLSLIPSAPPPSPTVPSFSVESAISFLESATVSAFHIARLRALLPPISPPAAAPLTEMQAVDFLVGLDHLQDQSLLDLRAIPDLVPAPVPTTIDEFLPCDVRVRLESGDYYDVSLRREDSRLETELINVYYDVTVLDSPPEIVDVGPFRIEADRALTVPVSRDTLTLVPPLDQSQNFIYSHASFINFVLGPGYTLMGGRAPTFVAGSDFTSLVQTGHYQLRSHRTWPSNHALYRTGYYFLMFSYAASWAAPSPIGWLSAAQLASLNVVASVSDTAVLDFHVRAP